MRKMLMVIAALACAAVTINASAGGPIGYPWETYGEVRAVPGGVERGFQLDGWAEQGVDWTKLGNSNWVFNTFVQPHLTLSDNQDQWWNNKVSLWTGIKLVNRDLAIGSSGQWGKLTFGVRGEFNQYLDGGINGRDDMRGVAFMQWSFGGDWKKK